MIYNSIIPYGRQNITSEDIKAVVDALQSDYLTQGPKIQEFENAFAEYVGSKFAVAVSNGTAALHLCTLALGVSKGDRVITTPITFVATPNCVSYCDGEVVFCDIDPTTYLLDINKVRSLLENSPKGTYRGLIPVNFAGRAVNMEDYRALADEYDLWIIEDACHSPGGYFTDSKGNKQNCGNGKFADLAIFSFHPVKHIACGEGGMITTNDESLFKKLLKLRTHGIVKDESEFTSTILSAGGKTNYPSWYMEMQTLGYNFRLTDFQAALGISQLSRADHGLARRIEIADLYTRSFKGGSFIKGSSGFLEGHAYHLYVIETEDRLGLYNYLRGKAIFPQIHYIPAHLMPYYRQFGWKEGDMPVAESYYDKCLSLPIFPTLKDEEQGYVISTIKEFFHE